MQSRQSNNNKRNGMSLTTINHGRLSGRVCALSPCLGVVSLHRLCLRLCNIVCFIFL